MRERLGAAAYESRPEQARMAAAVEQALESRSRLLAEAGTGVGKSFAYLVPAILRAIRRGEKVVIATSTIALQEQLIAKDIPLLAATLEQWGSTKAADGKPDLALVPVLAKGRGNYVSLRRLTLADQRADALLPDAESRRSLRQIQDWSKSTTDGTLSSLPILERPEVWDHARSDSDNCMGRKCPTYQQCFYQSARRELEKANLIICNHALFFADLALRTRHSSETTNKQPDREGGLGSGDRPTASASQVKAILPSYDHVVFDEAHGLEDAACEHFGLSLSQPRVMRLLRTLYTPKRSRGYLLERSLSIANTGAIDQALTLVQRAEHAAQQFFDDLLEFHRASARTNPSGGAGRLRQPNLIDNPLSPIMLELAVCLRRIRESIEIENERLELGAFAKRASEIAACATAMIDQSLGQSEHGDSAYAYWVEVEGDLGGPALRAGRGVSGPESRTTRFGPRVTLACAPIEIAAILRQYLFGRGIELPLDAAVASDDDTDESSPKSTEQKLGATKTLGLILTSATLATRAVKESTSSALATRHSALDPAFHHIATNLGIDTADTLQLGSPFNYQRQAKIIIDLTVPDPKSTRHPAPGTRHSSATQSSVLSPQHYPSALAARILHHLTSTNAGAFVLFTSFATMHACADALAPHAARHRWPLLVHGRDGSRQQILQRFIADENSILFGAASFWQGVDVRGEKLRNVIITRLPFEPPDRPLVQARCERIELRGGNPFMQDSLPRAIIRFKQGFGRLIRSKTDRGQVVVLDPRIVTARYGRLFLDALPKGLPIETIRPGGEAVEEFADALD